MALYGGVNLIKNIDLSKFLQLIFGLAFSW